MAEEAATTADAAGHAAVNRAVVLHGLDSEELAWRAQQGCQASFTELVHRYAPRLHMFLRRKTRPSHEVEDLVQDTFVKAYQNLDQYDRTWKFSTWLFTIATRLAVSHHRKRQSTASLLHCHRQLPAPDQHAGRQEESDSLWAMAAELPTSQHQALWLRYTEDMSVKEIAVAMSRSQVCIKVLLYRARMSLAKRLRERSDTADTGR
jgi:RNA polymerase sigma-70 factor (ECF subfamily)